MPEEIWNLGLDTAVAEANVARLLAMLEQAQTQVQQFSATPLTTTGAGGAQAPTQYAELQRTLQQLQVDATKYQAVMREAATSGGFVRSTTMGRDQFLSLSSSIGDATTKLQGFLSLSQEQMGRVGTFPGMSERTLQSFTRMAPEEVKGFDIRTLQSFEEQKSAAQYKEYIRLQQQPQAQPFAQMPPQPIPVLPSTENIDAATQSVSGLSQAGLYLQQILKDTGNDARGASDAMRGAGFSSDQVARAFKELGATPPARSLSELQRELREAKAGLDGSQPSLERYKRALADVAPVAKQAEKAEQDFAKSSGEAGHAYGSLGNLVQRQTERIAVGLLIWTTLRTAQEEIQKTIQSMEQYSVAVARFAAITQQSVGSAVEQYRALRDIAVERGFTPTQAAPAIQTTARFAKTPEEQQQLFGAGTKLAEFIGAKDPSQVITKLGEAIVATGGDFSTAAEKAEMLATAFVKSGSSAEQFLDTLSDAAAISEQVGLSYEQTVATIAAGATAGGQSASVSFQALNRISDTLDKLSGTKFDMVVSGFRDLGVNVLDSSLKMKQSGDIIQELAQVWSTLSPEDQTKAIELLFGGEKIKGQIKAAGKGIVMAWHQGMIEEFTAGQGEVLEAGIATIEDTFGKIQDRVSGKIEALRQEGDVAGAAGADIQRGIGVFLGSFFEGGRGGKRAAVATELSMDVQAKGAEKAVNDYRERVMSAIAKMSPREAEDAIYDFNRVIEGLSGNYTIGEDLAQRATISPEQAREAMAKAGTAAGQGFVTAIKSAIGDRVSNIIKEALSKVSTEVPQGRREDIRPLTLQEEIRKNIVNAATPEEALSVLPSESLDLTKYTMTEINQAKQMSVQLSLMELDALQMQLTLLGVEPSKISEIVAAKKKQLETEMLLLRTREGAGALMGMEAAKLRESLSQIDTQKQAAKRRQKEEEQTFNFQKLDITSEQFPQLQAVAGMLDALLSRLGSPEKQVQSNLLLGDNTFKTMNVRLSALSMAMEELTKVEKAQLSGTWNLPSGATAMVPIQSLDIQRWNAGQGAGGGVEQTMAALAALLEEMPQQPMRGGGEDGGYYYEPQRQRELPPTPGTLRPDPARPAVYRDMEQWRVENRGATFTPMPANRSLMPQDAFAETNRLLGGILSAVSKPEQKVSVMPGQKRIVQQEGGEAAVQQLMQIMSAVFGRISPVLGGDRQQPLGQRGEARDAMGQIARSMPSPTIRNEVQVSMLPVRASFTIPVMLNGQVIARAVQNIFQQWMAQASKSTGRTTTTLGGLR